MPIRVGVVGLGGVADRIHLPACAAVPGLSIAAGADPNPQTRQAIAEKFKIAQTYTGFEELREQAKPEFVVIGTPPRSHYDSCRRAKEVPRPRLLRKAVHAPRRRGKKNRRTRPPKDLKPGTYTGRVSIIAPGAINSPASVRVTLRVRDPIPGTMRASLSTIAFTAREGDTANPAIQKLAIKMEGETKPDWTATVTSLNGGNWLSISPASGKGDGEITVSARLTDLPAGVYAARINLSAPSATNPTLQIPVSFTVTRPKAVLPANGIVNAASLRAGPIAPGQLVTIAGDHLGPRTGISAKPNESTNRYANSLGGTRVLFDGVPGVVLYSSLNQVNAQVPFEIAGKSSVKVTIESAGFDPSEPLEVKVAETAPDMFTIDGRQAAALNQDYSYNTATTPAAAGSLIQLFFTGQGLTTPRVETGALAPAVAPFASPDQGVVILIDGQRAEVLFAGLAPGSLGLLQVNARIPASVTPSSNVLIGARFGNIGLSDPIQIAVKAADQPE